MPIPDRRYVATESFHRYDAATRQVLGAPDHGVEGQLQAAPDGSGWWVSGSATLDVNLAVIRRLDPFNHRINSGRIGVGAPDRVLGVSSREVVLPLPTGVLIGAVDTDPVGGMEPRPVHVFGDGDRVLVLVPGGVTIVQLSMLRAPWQQFPTAP